VAGLTPKRVHTSLTTCVHNKRDLSIPMDLTLTPAVEIGRLHGESGLAGWTVATPLLQLCAAASALCCACSESIISLNKNNYKKMEATKNVASRAFFPGPN